jgi:hypothetical protein
MFFRRTYIVPQLRFNDASGYVTDFTLFAGKLSIRFSTIASEDPASCGGTHVSRAEVTLVVREPKLHIREMLERSKHNSLPSGEGLFAAYAAAKSGAPWDQQVAIMMESMPEEFRDYDSGIRQRMDNGIERFVSLLRWRWAQWGPAKAFTAATPVQWSVDTSVWHYMPFIPRTSLKAEVTLAFDADRQTQIVGLFDDQGLSEPVYRELLREANQLEDSSARSSLILAVAAAEIAAKVLIQEVAPNFYPVDLSSEAGPPATTMYGDIPKLSLVNSIHGKILGIPARLLDELRRAVAARNALAHVGADPLDRESLISKINAIRDLILIVDHYRGFNWTLDQLTQATKDDLAALAVG